MRVGLDTSFRDRPFSGIGTYLGALEAELARIEDVELVPIIPPSLSIVDRLGTRATRFSWEFLRSGLAARRAEIDLLHMPLMAVPLAAGIPVVATVHDVIPYVMPEYRHSRAMQINLAVARRRIRAAAAVIAPSHHAAADIHRVLGVPDDRIHVTYEAADVSYVPVESIAPRERLETYGITGPYIFNVGGFDVRKNLPLLCRSFADLLPQLPADVTLIIAGAAHTDNPQVYPPLEPVVAELGIGNRIRFVGRIPEADKLMLMQHASLYVSPSVYEGFGLTVLEAMACGIPVIAANRTSLPEIVADAGLLVDPDLDAVSAAIFRVFSDPGLARDLTRRGIRRASEFSWSKTATETVAVYRSVLNK